MVRASARGSRQILPAWGTTVRREYSVLPTISSESVISKARRILLQEANPLDLDITRHSRGF